MAFQHSTVKDVNDLACVGTCSFPSQDGLTTRALSTWQGVRRIREPLAEDDHYYTSGLSPYWHVVSDLRNDLAHQHVPFVQHIQWARFYCAIPLRSAQGSVIGSFVVIDDRPRYGISEDELTFMEDISDTITEHLHSTIARSQRRQSERLIQALALFNSGKNTLRDWWLHEEDNRAMAVGRLAEVSADMTAPALREAKMNAEFGTRQAGSRKGSEEPPQPSRVEDSHHTEPSSLPSRHSNTGKGVIIAPTARGRGSTTVKFDLKSDFNLATAFDKTYGRASNLMREALGVHCVTFLDAHIVNATLKRTDSEDSEYSDAATEHSQDRNTSETEGSGTDPEPSGPSKVLGCSIRSEDSEDENTRPQQCVVPEALLRALMKRYPKGHIFNYSENSELCSSAGEEDFASSNDDHKPTRRQRIVRSDARRLLRVMPGARTIAVYPIWSDSHAAWRSCAILFDTSVTSPSVGQDIRLYVSAFAHSLRSELSRLDTLVADKAKETFISSISHELRSPLHGVLAGVEFLQDTELTIFQQEMAHTVAMAGRTLLDTINHLLDFTKISHFTSSQRRERRVADVSRREAALEANHNEIGVTANIDLADLTEELMESVVSASRFQPSAPKSHSRTESFGLSSRSKPVLRHRPASDSADGDRLSITLDIAWRQNWTVELQPGSWTRIVTNLVGNALKYTQRGTVSVRLESAAEDNADEGTCLVRLIVEDTGSGISEIFMANDLYTPFKQEDSHSTGTGLGLNIVKKIADSMGADIRIDSEVNKGTRVVITFCAKFTDSKPSKTRGGVEKPVEEEAWELGMDHFVLLTPTLNQDGQPGEPRSMVAKSVLHTCQEWLKCTTLAETDFNPSSGSNVCAITEEDLLTLAEGDPTRLSSIMDKIAGQKTSLLVLGSSVHSLSLRDQALQRKIWPIFLHQPIGPRKLLRAIITNASSSTPLEMRAPDLQISNIGYGATKSQGGEPLVSSLPFRPGSAKPSDMRMPSRRKPSVSSMAKTSESTEASASQSPETQIAAAVQRNEGSSQYDTVLLVEDNNVNMKLLEALMKKLSIKYTCANNGREALDLYRSSASRIFLVLMDMSMPVMDGYTSTYKIRETERTRRLPRTTIVALTGVTNADAKQQAFESGVDDYHTKPMNMRDLKKLIEWAQNREEA